MGRVEPELAGHPDRSRWNARYSGDFTASFEPHPLAVRALALDLTDGPVLELACGPSGSALAAAAAGWSVVAVDISEVALELLAGEARRRGLADRIELLQADLTKWRPERERFTLVLCTRYWDRELFLDAMAAVASGGFIAWEALTEAARRDRPDLPPQWCLAADEPACLLPASWRLIDQRDAAGGMTRSLIAGRPAD